MSSGIVVYEENWNTIQSRKARSQMRHEEADKQRQLDMIKYADSIINEPVYKSLSNNKTPKQNIDRASQLL